MNTGDTQPHTTQVYRAIVDKPGRGRGTYSRMTGLTRDQVSRALHRLVQIGQVEYHGQFGNRYYHPTGPVTSPAGSRGMRDTPENRPGLPEEAPAIETVPEVPIPALVPRETQPEPKRRKRAPAKAAIAVADLPPLKPRTYGWRLFAHLMTRPTRWERSSVLSESLGWAHKSTSNAMSRLLIAGYLEKHPADVDRARNYRVRPRDAGDGMRHVLGLDTKYDPVPVTVEPGPIASPSPPGVLPPIDAIRRANETSDPAVAALLACRADLAAKLERLDRAIAILRGE